MARSGTGRRRRRWVSVAAAAVLVMAGQAVAGPAGAGVPPTTITVDRAHPFGELPSDFVGLSYEMRELSTLCTTPGDCVGNFDARHGNLVALYHNLGRLNVRIGGNQLDRDTLWVPAGQQPPNPLPEWVADVVTPADIARLSKVLRATGWKAEVGINLAHFDPALAADQARSMFSLLGSRLSGVECGNEPNHYAGRYRPVPYGFAEHKLDWEACANLVGSNRIAAPDLSGPTGTAEWFSMFAQAEHAGINIHGGFGVCGAPLFNGRFQRYTPICAANEQDRLDKVYKAMPLYYGMWMATRMGSGQFLPVTVSSDRNVTAYAVRGRDGRLRIAVIEKDETAGAPVPVTISVGGHSGSASVLHLTGTSLASADGVAIQGATVDRNGHFNPGHGDRVPVDHGTVSLDLASGSAVIITL